MDIATFQKMYPFTIEAFEYNGDLYQFFFTAELYPEEDGLDFTGSYHCVLLSAARGTKHFDLLPDAAKRWESEPRGVDPGIIDIIGRYIQNLHK